MQQSGGARRAGSLQARLPPRAGSGSTTTRRRAAGCGATARSWARASRPRTPPPTRTGPRRPAPPSAPAPRSRACGPRRRALTGCTRVTAAPRSRRAPTTPPPPPTRPTAGCPPRAPLPPSTNTSAGARQRPCTPARRRPRPRTRRRRWAALHVSGWLGRQAGPAAGHAVSTSFSSGLQAPSATPTDSHPSPSSRPPHVRQALLLPFKAVAVFVLLHVRGHHG